jgi:wyosine [tRNA(Phe)-imidazoG37] synthetase (radical SAM superfamily)
MDALTTAFTSHSRHFDDFRWVYPVLSRRSGGLSIGVNLNPDKACNFDCPYCQVDRRGPAPTPEVDPAGVEAELREMLGRVAATGLEEVFPGVPAEQRKLSDVALSGDGEPTMRMEFPDICRRLSLVREKWIASGGTPFRLVLITNATLLDRPAVIEGLGVLCQGGGGEIWGKLDAGTEAFYRKVNVTRVPLAKILDNLSATALRFPLRIQTLFFERSGESPDEAEVDAWLGNLETIQRHGPLLGVQLHTVARATAVAGCKPMSVEWLEEVANHVRSRTKLDVEVHSGVESGSFASD